METVIISVIMCCVAVATGVFGWWLENGPVKPEEKTENETERMEPEEAAIEIERMKPEEATIENERMEPEEIKF